MSNRLFSDFCPVIHCAPRKRKTRPLVRLVLFLTTTAACGWLLHLILHTIQS